MRLYAEAQDQLGMGCLCLLTHIVIVNVSVCGDIIKLHVIQLAAEIHGRTVGQMTAVIQIHGQNGVTRLEHTEIGRQISTGTAVRLDIDMVIGMKYLAPRITAIFLNLVDIFAAAVVTPLIAGCALGGIALGIFIGQAGTKHAHHIFADKVLAGN